jgi:hypothetical protein
MPRAKVFVSRSHLLAIAVILTAGCQPISASRPPGPVQVDVSSHALPQGEVSVASDPNDSRVLVAASNSFLEGSVRVYGSTDGGRTWTSDLAPLPRAASLLAGDPWVGIDLSKRQYLAIIAAFDQVSGGRLYVLSRAGPTGAWAVPSAPVAPITDATSLGDDKDALTVDASPLSPHLGRIYVAWTRDGQIVIAHSDDQAVSWSTPVALTELGGVAIAASIGISKIGDVYLSWLTEAGLTIERSTDGGDHWSLPSKFGRAEARACQAIPAIHSTCANEFPSVVVDRSSGKYAGRVYAVFASKDASSRVSVFVNVFNADLTPVAGSPWRVDRPLGGANADRFHPVAAVNQQSGVIWACFYDTAPDPHRIQTYFSCAVSRDGGEHWAPPAHAATTASDEIQWRAFTGRAGTEYGDYEGLAVAGGAAHPIWTDSRDLARLQEEIYTTTLTEGDF